MSNSYIPTKWSAMYQQLRGKAKQDVIDDANALFFQQTGHQGSLGENSKIELRRAWLRARDEVMKTKYGNTALATDSNEGIALASDHDDDGHVPLWITQARTQLSLRVKEKKDEGASPFIVAYIITCHVYFDSGNTKLKYKRVFAEGGEFFHWCSAFVNWCFVTSGKKGTNSGLAYSWKKWGRRLDEPKRGAVVVTRGGKHVALIDKVGNQFMQLGGNQGSNHDSVTRFNYRKKKGHIYRWPSDD